MADKKNNSGALFVNDKKQSDKHPDYKGNAVINGVEYWLAGWKRESQSGRKYLSIAFEPKDKQTAGDDMPNDFDF